MNFDKDKYRVYTWKNWMMLFWILNPVGFINELILGQRVPKVSLEDKTVDKPRIERTFIPCPHCEKLHDGRTWSTQNGTGYQNWFGLYCKNCGNTIPCLTNGISFIILALTFPIWGWFRKRLKAKWLEKQPNRYENIDIDQTNNPFSKKDWITSGLIWGALMFLTMSIAYPYLVDHEITWKTLLSGLIMWTIGGLLFGYSMKIWTNRSVRKKGKIQLPIE